MHYQLERLENLAHSQQLLSELFVYIGKNQPQGYLAETPHNFFRLWAGQDPTAQLKVFTARDEQNALQGCVMAMVIANPLFVAKPFVLKLVDLTNGDKAFEDYVKVVLDSL